MSSSKEGVSLHFQKLIEQGNPVGEVIGVNKFIVSVKGLHPANAHALVMFEDGSKGFIEHVLADSVLILHLGTEMLKIGMVAVTQHDKLVTKVGKDLVGRVINVLGEPLDGKGPIAPDSVWPVFNSAPPIYERELLDLQLETGVTSVDGLFPIVRGQRLAILGDNKSGKTTLATQLTINQKNTDIKVVYVLIGKRRADIDELLTRLNETDSLKNAVVIVSTLFESLIMTYLAPYVGCAIAEYFWQACDQDTMIVYDDLTSHAQAYREVALLSNISPGRDSYPGDMFYAHSSLLERAGKLMRNHKTLTSLPIVLTPNNDITAYLPTNIMSITDGQWIMDMEVFLAGHRPALSTGLSVTRVGGVGQNKRQKGHTVATLKALATFRQAEEYAHFGSELALSAHKDLARGKTIYEVFSQSPTETYSFMEQQLMLDIVINLDDTSNLDVKKMKENLREIAKQVKDDGDFEKWRDELQNKSMISGTPIASTKPPEGELSHAAVAEAKRTEPKPVEEPPLQPAAKAGDEFKPTESTKPIEGEVPQAEPAKETVHEEPVEAATQQEAELIHIDKEGTVHKQEEKETEEVEK
ncbi:sodium-transporting two-sector ATPase [Candidatus Saccharibacteria bacterium]|nr:sodium-transporting two-sector ATPase [Candidatus Saccharibacteria bacterium]